MAVHALTEVELAPGQERKALWAAMRLARKLALHPGFHGVRVYRAENTPETLLVLIEWAEWEQAAEAEAPVAALLGQARAACARWESRRLEPLFQLQFPRRRPTTGLAQALRLPASSLLEAPARQKELGLRAMALPGVIGVLGGRCTRDPQFLFCALEFAADDSKDDFATSPARQEWDRQGETIWWQKEPRLEVSPDLPRSSPAMSEHRSETAGKLGIAIESSVDGATVILRLRGCLDDSAAARFERVRDAVVDRGCRALTLDVSELTAATTAGFQILLATARQVKKRGGRFSLADNQGRFDQIVRGRKLDQVLCLEPGSKPKRRPLTLRLPHPGKA